MREKLRDSFYQGLGIGFVLGMLVIADLMIMLRNIDA